MSTLTLTQDFTPGLGRARGQSKLAAFGRGPGPDLGKRTTAEGLLTRPLFNVPFMGPKMGARSTLLKHVCSRSLPLRGNSS